MPFGYLEFSRAIERDLCPPAHVCMRACAPPLAAAAAGAGPGSGPGSGSGSGLGLGSLPGLVLFESGLKGMGRSATRTRPAPRPDPLSGSKAPVGQPTGATVGSNRCNGSDRTVATFRWVRTCWPLLERYILSLFLSSEHFKFLRSELGSGVLK